MRSSSTVALALAFVATLAGCGGGSTLPSGLALTWNANGTSGDQYQTLHLASGSATISVTQDAVRQSFTAFLSGAVPSGTAPGSGPPAASSPCTAFSLDATTTALAHTVTPLATGSCYLVAEDAALAYTQLLITNP